MLIEITTNHWKLPSVANAFDTVLEGSPSEEQRAAILAETVVARAGWQPTREGYALLDQLRGFIGCRCRIQIWDSTMFLFPEEGPYPLKAVLDGIAMLYEDEFLQPHLELSALKIVENDDGYSPLSHLKSAGNDKWLLSVGDLYSVIRLDGGCCAGG
jgi:hypothetical protein